MGAMTMSMREEHALWARQVRREIDDAKQARLELGVVTRHAFEDDGRQSLAGEESQDPGGWEAA